MGKITGRKNGNSQGDLQLDLVALAQNKPNARESARNYNSREVYIVPAYETREEQEYEVSRKRSQKKTKSGRTRKFRFKVAAVLLGLVAVAVFLIWDKNPQEEALSKTAENNYEKLPEHPEWTADYLTVSGYARPGDELKEVKSTFVHYTANPGTSAEQNRSYFENLRITKERAASAHFIIGYEGEIINCIPTSEKAYAVIGRNDDSISIECCYKDESGIFTEETYESLVELLAWLLDAYDLKSEDILRHYDAGGKMCPLYYVEHEDAWEQLKKDVEEHTK